MFIYFVFRCIIYTYISHVKLPEGIDDEDAEIEKIELSLAFINFLISFSLESITWMEVVDLMFPDIFS